MKRKAFFKAAAVTAAALPFVSRATSSTAKDNDRTGSPVKESSESVIVSGSPLDRIEKLGEETLEEARNRYHGDIFGRLVPNMLDLVVDHELGGFMLNYDSSTNRRINTNKHAWFEGRGIWFFSFLYNHLNDDPTFLDVARKSADFVLKLKPDGDQFWPGGFTREGVPLSGPGDIFGDLYIAEGLGELARATGEERYLQEAIEIIFKCVNRFDQPDYNYHLGWVRPEAPRMPGIRVLNHWMVLLGGLTQILEHHSDERLLALMDRGVDAVMNRHMHPDYHLLNEVLTHDYKIPDNRFAEYAYTGHGTQILWILMHEADRRNDAELFRQTAESFLRHVRVSKDPVYGGYFREVNHVGRHEWNVDKALQAQEEVQIGLLFIAEHTGDRWAIEEFAEQERYMQEKFVRPGYPFWIDYGDRRLESHHANRAENYHHTRYLMQNLLALERIRSRGGIVTRMHG